jgi:hypothetical protein
MARAAPKSRGADRKLRRYRQAHRLPAVRAVGQHAARIRLRSPFDVTESGGAHDSTLDSGAFVLTRSLNRQFKPLFYSPRCAYLRGQVHCKLPERYAFFQTFEEALGNARQSGLGTD